MKIGNQVKAVFRLSFGVMVLSTLLSCTPNKGAPGQSSDAKPETVDQSAQEIERRAQAYLKPILHIGDSPTNLVERFGPPVRKDDVSNDEYCLTFFFTNQDQAARSAGVGGVDAFFVSNRLSRWLPIYRDLIDSKRATTESSHIMVGEQTLALFVQSDKLKKLLRTFDTKGAADVTNLNISPDLKVIASVTLENPEPSKSFNRMVVCVVESPYVTKLKALIDANIGKRIVIVWHDNVIAAPMISEPLTSNRFLVTITDSHSEDILRAK